MYPRLLRGVSLCLLLVWGILAWGGRPHRAYAQAARAIPAEELADAIANARDGDTILVSGGIHLGTLRVAKSLTLLGENWPVLDGQGKGNVLELTGQGTVVKGFVIRGSGSSLDQENSGIEVSAPEITIEGNLFEDTLFGVYLREADRSVLQSNVIHGKDLDVPRRGDAIRVWFSNDVIIDNNTIASGRDVVLWYSERLTLRGNTISDGRYGLHFMYCDDARIENNRLLHNSVGAFLMYSRRLTMQHNTVAYNRGPSGYGVGMKDLDDAVVTNNLFLDNRVGAHLDGTPREVDSIGVFEGNVFAYNDIGVEMLPAVRHNEFFSNSFVENQEQVAIAGGGSPGVNAWTVGEGGNYWSDYAGYDADRDGRGDIPFKSERLFESLTQREPNLRLFLFSPASSALEFAARAFPLVRPQPKLVDELPMTSPLVPQEAPPLPSPENLPWLWQAPSILGLAAGLAAIPRIQWRRYQFPDTKSWYPLERSA